MFYGITPQDKGPSGPIGLFSSVTKTHAAFMSQYGHQRGETNALWKDTAGYTNSVSWLCSNYSSPFTQTTCLPREPPGFMPHPEPRAEKSDAGRSSQTTPLSDDITRAHLLDCWTKAIAEAKTDTEVGMFGGFVGGTTYMYQKTIDLSIQIYRSFHGDINKQVAFLRSNNELPDKPQEGKEAANAHQFLDTGELATGTNQNLHSPIAIISAAGFSRMTGTITPGKIFGSLSAIMLNDRLFLSRRRPTSTMRNGSMQ